MKIIKYLFYLGGCLCVTVHATSDYTVLAQQLQTQQAHLQAFSQLKAAVKQDESALLPMFEFLCSKYYTSPDGVLAYKQIKEVQQFIQDYATSNSISDKTIDALFSIKNQCREKRQERHYNLMYTLESISKTRRLSDKTIRRVLELGSLQLVEDIQKVRSNYTPTYLQILKHQTRYQKLPDRARRFAIRAIDERATNLSVTYPALDMLIGQLRYRDTQSEEALRQMMQPGNNRQLRRSVTDRMVTWHEQQNTLDGFSGKVLAIAEKEQHPEMQQYYQKLLNRLLRTKQLSAAHVERIAAMAGDKYRYGSEVALMEAYEKKSESSQLSDKELQRVLDGLGSSNSIVGQAAVRSIINIDEAGHMTRELHEQLIRRFFAPQQGKVRYNPQLQQLILNNIPYRNVEKEFQYGRYPDDLLLGVMQSIRVPENKGYLDPQLKFIQQVNEHQTLPEAVIAGLYDVYAQQVYFRYKKPLFDLLRRHYQVTGYLRLEVLANQLGGNDSKLEQEIYSVVRNELTNTDGLEEGLFRMYANRQLNDRARLFFLREVIRTSFEQAHKKVLPPATGESDEFQYLVWHAFYADFKVHSNLVDEKLLREATGHKNMKIRHLAWQLLEGHGVSTPFRIKWEKEGFRKEVYATTLFFGGGPFSLIVGSLLFLKVPRGRKIKYPWMGVMRIVFWLLATLAMLAATAGVIFITGLSHSGPQYDFLIRGFALIFGAYFMIALFFRLIVPTVLQEQVLATDQA